MQKKFIKIENFFPRHPWVLTSNLPMYKNCPKDKNNNAIKIQNLVICLPSIL